MRPIAPIAAGGKGQPGGQQAAAGGKGQPGQMNPMQSQMNPMGGQQGNLDMMTYFAPQHFNQPMQSQMNPMQPPMLRDMRYDPVRDAPRNPLDNIGQALRQNLGGFGGFGAPQQSQMNPMGGQPGGQSGTQQSYYQNIMSHPAPQQFNQMGQQPYGGFGQQPGMGGQSVQSIAQLINSVGGMSAIQNNPQLLQSPQFQGLFGGGQQGQQPPQPPQMSVQDFNQQRQNLVAQRDQALKQGRNANDIVKQINDLTRNFGAQRNSSVRQGMNMEQRGPQQPPMPQMTQTQLAQAAQLGQMGGGIPLGSAQPPQTNHLLGGLSQPDPGAAAAYQDFMNDQARVPQQVKPEPPRMQAMRGIQQLANRQRG